MTSQTPAGLPSAVKQQGTSQYVGFELAGQKYVCRIERIQEIVIPGRVTTIPEVPAYVSGVSNLRGTIIPIVDLRLLFGLPGRPVDAETRTIVVNVGRRVIGCTVDTVSQVVRVPDDRIQPAPDTVAGGAPRYIEGFIRVDDDLLILLDTDQLLAPEHLDDVHRATRPPVPTTGDA